MSDDKPRTIPTSQEELEAGVNEMAEDRNSCFNDGHNEIETLCTVTSDGDIFLFQRCMKCGKLYKGFNEVNTNAIRRVIENLKNCLIKMGEKP